MKILSKLRDAWSKWQNRDMGVDVDPGPGDPDQAVEEAKLFVTESVKEGAGKKMPRSGEN